MDDASTISKTIPRSCDVASGVSEWRAMNCEGFVSGTKDRVSPGWIALKGLNQVQADRLIKSGPRASCPLVSSFAGNRFAETTKRFPYHGKPPGCSQNPNEILIICSVGHATVFRSPAGIRREYRPLEGRS
jgi:hypothetical protein